MKYAPVMDLYTDFLLTSPNIVSAGLVSEVVNKEYSHDKITRMLAQNILDQKEYWQVIKPTVRQVEKVKGVISIDDTIEEKPYTDENEYISWHFDHTVGHSVKGINILTFTYVNTDFSLPVKLPIAFELVKKDTTQTKTVKKDGKLTTTTTPCASITKNELVRQRLHCLVYQNHVVFGYVAFDTWFSSADNINFIVNDLKKHVVCGIKDNRTVCFDVTKPKKEQQWLQVSATSIEPNKAYKVRLKDVPFDVLLVKRVYHNLDGSVGVQYLICTDTDLNAEQIDDLYKQRWSSEDLHKSLKQNTALEKMPAKTQNAQANHVFASMVAQVKLECVKLATKKNHYQLKRNILIHALKSAWSQINELKELCLEKNIVLPNFKPA
jgi:DDE superfamily endonuclease